MASVTDPKTGATADITSEHELKVRSVSTDVILHQVEEGEAFNINTSTLSATINLTDATAGTALLYVKNTDINDLIATSVTISTSESTAGVNDRITIKQVGGFTAASDIITSGSDGFAVNRNTGKASRIFDGVIKTGATGLSFTGGAAGLQTMDIFTESKTFDLSSAIPIGGEFGITVDPPASNTGMLVMISLNFHIRESL